MAIRELRDRLDDGLLARFYDELYLPAFAHQREPLEVWRRQLWGEAWPYELSIVIAGESLDDAAAARLDGGIVSELYPASACGFLTYLVVAPAAREAGLGRSLLDGARRALAARAQARGLTLRAVFGEVADAARLARFERWGARAVEIDYVQPSLGPGLARDPDLRLIAFFDGEPPATLPGAVVADFVRELYAMTEGGGGEMGVPAEVRLKPAARDGVHGG
jgi:GNAT superfamily N-acetyltransferase